jgi:hypothetical protein
MRAMLRTVLPWLGLLLGHAALAQPVFRDDAVLASDRPEAWAMNTMAATALLTGFDAPPARGEWRLALELDPVPHLSERERTVGFEGTKVEDLNKSPVFGRVRAAVGLPAGWHAELAWTPPATIDGTHADDAWGVGFGHALWTRDTFALQARAFAQHAIVWGDITCPVALVGVDDPGRNPYGCEAPSHDRFRMDQYGAELGLQWDRGAWRGLASVGGVRTELQVEVDALTFGVRDRSRLWANGWRPFLSVGASRAFGRHWRGAAAWLHVPLRVRRDAGDTAHDEPFDGLRLQVARTWR